MKLKIIIDTIKSKIGPKPSFDKFLKRMWKNIVSPYNNSCEESENLLFAKSINLYLNQFFVSKNEGLFWLKSVNTEIQELRQQIEELKSKITD